MKPARKNLTVVGMILSLLIAMPLFFQNCAKVHMTGDDSSSSTKESGNGGPYAGALKIYRFYSSSEPCAEKDLKGKPLPNQAVMYKADSLGASKPFLAREACADLAIPLQLADALIQSSADSPQDIIYNGNVLSAANPPGEFDVIAGLCPADKTPIAGATRTNLFVHSQDWIYTIVPPLGLTWTWNPADVSGWYSFAGARASLYSTIQGQPAFVVDRNDSTKLESWRRHSQYVQLKSNTDYVYSFVAKPGTATGVDVHLFRGLTQPADSAVDENIYVTFDFQNGNASVGYSRNVAGTSVTMTPFAGGYLCSVYFHSTPTAGDAVTNIGLAPTTRGASLGLLGDSFLGTAAQLVEVGSFCQ